MKFSYWNSDPIELRILKQQLANFSCKCLNCKRYNKKYTEHNPNVGVRANQRHGSVDRFSQGTSYEIIENPIKVDKTCSYNLINTGEGVCPSCQIIIEFLKETRNKVLKDEQSETNPLTYCDKSIDQSIEYLEKSTSIAEKCKSCNMLKADSKECDECKNVKKRNNDKVSFDDSDKNKMDSEKKMLGYNEKELSVFGAKKSTYGSCICLEKFINAIGLPAIQ